LSNATKFKRQRSLQLEIADLVAEGEAGGQVAIGADGANREGVDVGLDGPA